jgi:sporulation protein YlmC with PRC-barrel domain
MDLVRDLLDKQVVDRHGVELGRVDTIIFEMRADGAPVVAAIEIGLVTVARRLHPFVGRCARAIEVVFDVDANRPVRVPFSKVGDTDAKITLDLTSSELSTLALEQRARRVVSAIPGSS